MACDVSPVAMFLDLPSCIPQDFTDKKWFHSNQWNTLKTNIESKGCCHKLFSCESTLFPSFLHEMLSYRQFISNLLVGIHKFSVAWHNCQQLQYTLHLGLCYSHRSNKRHLLVSNFKPQNLSISPLLQLFARNIKLLSMFFLVLVGIHEF